MRPFFTLSKIAVFAMLMAFSASFAQSPQQGDRQVKVKIIQSTPGNTRVIDETVPVEGNANVEEILRQYDVDTDFGDLQPGETLEITIRKKKKETTLQDMVIELDPMVEMPAMPNFPPPPPLEEPSNKPMLGVYYTPVPDDIQQKYSLKNHQGTYISSVIKGTGAETAGLQKGDIILSVDGENVESRGDLPRIIQSHKPGDVVKVAYSREGSLKFTKVKLGDWKSDHGQNRVFNFDFDFDFDDAQGSHQQQKRIIIKDGEVQEFELENDGEERAFLGVFGGSKTGDKGAEITGVQDNSTASAMGLEKGDVVTAVNGKSVANFGDLGKEINALKPGDKITLDFLRNGESISSTGTLKAKKGPRHIIKHFQKAEPQSKIVEETTIFLSMEEISGQEAASLQESTQGQFKAEGAFLDLENLNFFPNPSDGLFNLSFDLSSRGPIAIQVFDLNGVSVYKNVIQDFSGNFNDKIDIREESKGVYFLQVSQGEKIFNKKIVIQ